MVSSRLAREIPSGMHNANLFPWWVTGNIELGTDTGVPANGAEFSFAVSNTYRSALAAVHVQSRQTQPFMKNDQPGPVAVHELRFWSNQPFWPQGVTTWAGDFMEGMLLKMDTDLQQGIITEWIGAKALNTEEDNFFHGGQWAGVYKLPAPYFIQAPEQFGIRLRVRHDVIPSECFLWAVGDTRPLIDIQLRGKDPLTETPICINKQIEVPAASATFPLDVVFMFDDGRDAPVKDMILTDIAFGNVSLQATAPKTAPWLSLDPLEIKFMPGSGPDWTKDRFTHLAQGLFEDIGVTWEEPNSGVVSVRRPIIHRPKRPYILRPGDSFRIHATWDRNEAGTAGLGPDGPYALHGDTRIYCRASGVQEGTSA